MILAALISGSLIGLAIAFLRPVTFPIADGRVRSVNLPRPTAKPGKPYVVREGDSLSQIALQETGNAQNWPALYEHNRAVLSYEQDVRCVRRGPDAIFQGTAIAIPVKLLRAA